MRDRSPELALAVEKPARYIGGEDGSGSPDWSTRVPGGPVSWLLSYPDTYEIGLPNQGLQILYEILNEREDAVAERLRELGKLNHSPRALAAAASTCGTRKGFVR